MISQAMSQRMRILRPCSTPGCGELGAGGPCELHRRRRQREEDDRRGSSTARGYDASHRRLRILCFERDDWRCVDCDWEPDIIRDCREAGLESPPTAEVLTELRSSLCSRRDGTCTPITRYQSKCGRTCDSISITCGRDVTAAIVRRP